MNEDYGSPRKSQPRFSAVFYFQLSKKKLDYLLEGALSAGFVAREIVN